MKLEKGLKKEIEVVESVNDVKPSEKKYLGTILKKPNHHLYEVNTKTGEIKPAEYDDKKAIRLGSDGGCEKVKKRELTINENCLYISAMNKKNVVKILKRDYSV